MLLFESFDGRSFWAVEKNEHKQKLTNEYSNENIKHWGLLLFPTKKNF